MRCVSIYTCETPVVMIIFNRPQFTERVFEQIKSVKPRKLYIVSDGCRPGVPDDTEKVQKCRDIVNRVDWGCEVTKIYADTNLGCKKRVITGLDQVFQMETKAIILEDDCVPTDTFFQFCEWGLNKYEHNNQVAVVSGSNLLDYNQSVDIPKNVRAGFSMYINCWGWATWRHIWSRLDPYLSLREVNSSVNHILGQVSLSQSQRIFWREVFKHSVYSSSIWDFYLQYAFFKYSLISVYPRYNLVGNIGFGEDSTHTVNKPDFVHKSWPDGKKFGTLMNLKEPETVDVNELRDREVLKVIYGYSLFSTGKLCLGNILRYLGIL